MIFYLGTNSHAISSVAEQVSTTLKAMTLDEKLSLIAGVDGFDIPAIPRLGLPRIHMSDGPVGTRNDGPTTAYPAGEALAASWDPALGYQFGAAIGKDARARGVHFWLGPGIDLVRVPQNGRNFEYLGEDPILSSSIASQIVKATRAAGVAATVKHYAANNHEDDRNSDSSNVSETALRELYLRNFEETIKQGGALAVMCSYNLINGIYASANHHLLTDVLKDDWKFPGIVMSDWGAAHNTVDDANAGLDLEMPGPDYFAPDLIKAALSSGDIQQSTIDDKVRRLLTVEYTLGWPLRPQKTGIMNDPHNAVVAEKIAEEGIVLLRNQNHVLPLRHPAIKNILVIGPNANTSVTGGGGSSFTTPLHSETIYQALHRLAPEGLHISTIVSAGGDQTKSSISPYLVSGSLQVSYFSGKDLSGNPVYTGSESSIQHYWTSRKPSPAGNLNFSARWTGDISAPKSGTYYFSTASDDGVRLFIDDKPVIDNWTDHGQAIDTGTVSLEKGKTYHLRVEYYQGTGEAVLRLGIGSLSEEAAKLTQSKLMKNADIVVACMGLNPSIESEGVDHSFELPSVQQMVLKELAPLHKKVVLVLNGGSALDIAPYVPMTSAILQAWYPGMEGNTALANILFGKANPSGKLPMTFPKTLEGTYYQYAYPPKDHVLNYSEGLLTGYRYFTTTGTKPLYPFGFGLSYTHFSVQPVTIRRTSAGFVARVKVANTGDRSGDDVVQIYAGPSVAVKGMPTLQLVGFKRVNLARGQKTTIEIPVPKRFLAHWSEAKSNWYYLPSYRVWGGDSSENLTRFSKTVAGF